MLIQMFRRKEIHLSELHPLFQNFFIFHITAHPPALQPFQGYFSSPFRQKMIHNPQRCLLDVYELREGIYMLSGTVRFCSQHHQEQQQKVIITVLIIGIFSKRTEQIDPFRHDSHTDSVFNCINLIVDHLVHILSNKLA